MSGSSGGSPPTVLSSLREKFKKYQFKPESQRKGLKKESAAETSSDVKNLVNSPPSNCKKTDVSTSPSPHKSVSLIENPLCTVTAGADLGPESPIQPVKRKAHVLSSDSDDEIPQVVNGMDFKSESSAGPLKRNAKVLSTDTEDEAPKVLNGTSSKKPKHLIDEEKREIIETALIFIQQSCPRADVLVVQDALIQADWDIEKAKSQLTGIYSSNGNANNSSGVSSKKRNSTDCNGSSKTSKRKRKSEIDTVEEDNETDEDDNGQRYKGSKVYDSDADSDEEISDDLSGDKRKVFDFLSKADTTELQLVNSCSKKKADMIIDGRPYKGWKDLVTKIQNRSGIGCEILNNVQLFIQTREVADALIKKCKKLARKMEMAVAAGSSNVQSQPSIMAENLKLSDYQLIGLNWLLVMHSHRVNGILADEMGLGKTVQIIAFLSYLKEKKLSLPGKPHLVVVPSSTLENWQNEFKRWSPSINFAVYYGSQDDRKYQRIQWSRNGFDDIEVVLTTYSMITSCPEERKMFRIIPLHYAVFDEAHMLKNMYSQRYENLNKINAPNRILVTGTPLQNNLLELMSLLAFVMPKVFDGKEDTLKALFARGNKQQVKGESEISLPEFERTRINLAKDIMKPFVLRRLKSDVLKGLPKKTEEIIRCSMTEDQEKKYKELITVFSKQACKELRDCEQNEASESGMAMYSKLRRLANHPLLLRYHFKDEILKDMAKRLQNDIRYKDKVFEYIFDDLYVMSDFELHSLCLEYKSCYDLRLPSSVMGLSGKLMEVEKLLPKLRDEGHRVLIFSQFVIVLDVLEEHFKNRGYKYLRLDGSTPVTTRQDLIDEYNKDSSILIFMLSTRAGGLGINLTTADTVIIHDVDPNPHNDKQAEDRCHRIGQTRPVRVLRLISKGTIEENILSLAQEKLLLEKEVSSSEDNEQSDKKSVARLLKQALGLDKNNRSNSPKKSSSEAHR